MSKDDLAKGWRGSLWLPTAGIAVATPFLVWFVIGDVSFRGGGGIGLEHGYGPYQVGPESGYVVGGLAAVVAAAAIAVLVIYTRQGVANRRSWAVVGALAMAGAAGTGGWRTLTAGVRGANIGGGFVLLAGPALIAGLLVWAGWLAGSGGHPRLRRTLPFTRAAVLVAPLLYLVVFALGWYGASAGFITARQYADVQNGQTRSAVHQRLGREGDDLTDIFFKPAAPGLSCDFYTETNRNYSCQFCFRSDVLVSKDFSKEISSPQLFTD